MLNQELKSICFALEEDARALVSDNDNKKQLLEQQAKAMEELNQKWRKTRDALRAEKMRIQDLGKTKEQLQQDLLVVSAERDEYRQQAAELTGHTNQKQKIQHMMRLKEENTQLRKVRARRTAGPPFA